MRYVHGGVCTYVWCVSGFMRRHECVQYVCACWGCGSAHVCVMCDGVCVDTQYCDTCQGVWYGGCTCSVVLSVGAHKCVWFVYMCVSTCWGIWMYVCMWE